MPLIAEMLRQSCQTHADRTAMRVKRGGRWVDTRYGTILQQTDRIAAGLASWGLEPGDRCALLGSSSPEWVMAYLGILTANGIAVPIDKELKPGEVRHILRNSGARILFTEAAFLEPLSETLEELPELELVVLLNAPPRSEPRIPLQVDAALTSLADEWHRLARDYGMSEDDVARFETLAEGVLGLLIPPTESTPTAKPDGMLPRLAAFRGRPAARTRVEPLEALLSDEAPPSAQRLATDAAVILYTSGTTGRSKGAMLSHANITSNLAAATAVFGLDTSMTTLSFLPINHVFEQVCGILLPLSLGGTISFAESLKRLGDNLNEVKPNFLLGVPAVFRLLHDRLAKKIEGQPLSRMLYALPPTRGLVTRKIRAALGGRPVFVSGGAALDPAVSKGLSEMGVVVYQGYGITETSPIISAESPRLCRLGSVGLPIPEVQVKIHQPNDDGVGEIWVKGPNVMLGYYNNPEATAEVLSEGWYHTGDLGRLDADGVLSICGRVKNLIVTANGKNVYPEEVENELLNSPFIAEIMVYGHKVSETVEEVHAMIYPDPTALEAHLSERDIEDLIRREVLEYGRNLADYKRVRRFTLRNEEFPKTTTRKIKRFAVEADIVAER